MGAAARPVPGWRAGCSPGGILFRSTCSWWESDRQAGAPLGRDLQAEVACFRGEEVQGYCMFRGRAWVWDALAFKDFPIRWHFSLSWCLSIPLLATFRFTMVQGLVVKPLILRVELGSIVLDMPQAAKFWLSQL